MQLRPLGRSGLQVSPLAFGGNVFGWTVDEKLSLRLLDAWLDAGFNFVDTADVYSSWVPGHSGGESEAIIGKWLRQSGKRNHVVLATKVGKPMGEGMKGLSPAYIRQAVDASLKRLQTDHIDLYQSHDDDADTPLADTLGAFAELIKAGKVRAIGASNYSAPRLAEALDVAERQGLPRYESLQPLYNLYDRAVFEEALEPLCLERGVAVINFYALAAGFLTGKYRSEADAAKSARGASTTKKYLNPRGLRILGALDEVAKTRGATPGQVALAWQIARPSITAPIASATSIQQLHDLAAAAQLSLDAEAIALIDQASAEAVTPR
ncbi:MULTISPECIES: aldo/keto reductase [unclassified Variovorax]|uniref:aldo/keto reductase n=1 Tax=unclassified Variovorax TaxID=663243 RepID=UPI00076BEF2A|nr:MULTISPECIES: aldo/keto reductase [unclassified Variovorax]KWT64422.1 Oxidoreductase [Variovorax sp. WDL1]PNG56295.1 General stress protein 69 [Variovorax sp. B4]PNG57719.1 General stress protein 69 [Variovorax sp. B2]VTV09853.1 General stress protein 69 [Variovorax sp. WDL1]